MNLNDLDLTAVEALGYRVECNPKADTTMPFFLHGKRGACYGLMQNLHNPALMFLCATSSTKTIKGWSWFKAVDGKLIPWS